MKQVSGTTAGTNPPAGSQGSSGPASSSGSADPAGETAREAYSFACMKCGHGWEQQYEIRHREYADGRPMVVYYANGEQVPSPLTDPTCLNCEGHVVRIMRSGRVSTAEAALPHH